MVGGGGNGGGCRAVEKLAVVNLVAAKQEEGGLHRLLAHRVGGIDGAPADGVWRRSAMPPCRERVRGVFMRLMAVPRLSVTDSVTVECNRLEGGRGREPCRTAPPSKI